MTAPAPFRYPEKFENDAGTVSYSFAGNVVEWQPSQRLRQALASAAGASYAHDFLGTDPWAKDVSIEAIRLELSGADAATVMAALDTLQEKLTNIGRGRLFTLLGASDRRWAAARLSQMPAWQVTQDDSFFLAVVATFVRESDWFATAATAATVAGSSATENFTVANAGNAPARSAVFQVTAKANLGFSNLVLANNQAGYTWSVTTTRDSVAIGDIWEVDGGRNRIRFWNGSAWADDYSIVTLGTAQVGVMGPGLAPGNNDIQIDCAGTPNYDFDYSFYSAWH